MAEQAKCKSCGAAILWARTTNEKKIPLDPEPHAEGNITIRKCGETVLCRVVGKGDTIPVDAERYRSHFVSCPNSAAHRKPRPAFSLLELLVSLALAAIVAGLVCVMCVEARKAWARWEVKIDAASNPPPPQCVVTPTALPVPGRK